MVLYIRWILAGFLVGLLLGKWPKKQQMKLKEQFDRLNICKAMSIDDARRVLYESDL